MPLLGHHHDCNDCEDCDNCADCDDDSDDGDRLEGGDGKEPVEGDEGIVGPDYHHECGFDHHHHDQLVLIFNQNQDCPDEMKNCFWW